MVKRTERGWGGHFCCGDRCLFRRNTLLEYNDIKIVVSTVGAMTSLDINDGLNDLRNNYNNNHSFEIIGCNRYYETMAFHSDTLDTRYHDADVSREVSFESPWCIDHLDADDKANQMHETVVDEISNGLLNGETYE